MAVIGLEGMRFNGPHGYYPEEEVLGNDFLIDIYLDAMVSGAAFNDDLNGTVNYETVYRMVQSEMRKSAQLIETLGDRILGRITDFYPNLKGVRLVIRKLNPPLSGPVNAAYVELKTGSFGGGGIGAKGGKLGGGLLGGGLPDFL